MDPIESMLRSINPVPDETAGTSSPVVAPEPEVSAAPHTAANRPTAGHPRPVPAAAARPNPERPSSLRPARPRRPWFANARSVAIAVAAVVLIAAAGVFGVLAQGVLKPQPAGPVPAPATTSAPSPTPVPSPTSAPATQPAAPPVDPTTGISCTFDNVTVTDQAGQMLSNMKTFPGDFQVLGCAGGWLAFELTDGGYQRLLDEGAGNGSGDGNGSRGDFYFAKFDGSSYLYNKYIYVQGWDVIQTAGGTAADKAAELDSRLERNFGISPGLRPALVGAPESTPATSPAATTAASDPDTGAACTMDSVVTADNPEAWVMKDINAHPENYTVLACAGGWLSFKLSDAGYQRWLDEFKASNLIQESSPFFYFAKYNGTAYEFKLGQTVSNWEPRPGVDPRPDAMIKALESDMKNAGVPVSLREQLVGSPED